MISQRFADTCTRLAKPFLISCAIILSLTAAAKLISAVGNAKILLDVDPLLNVNNRDLLYAVAVSEIAVVLFLIVSSNLLPKMVSVAWLSLSFVVYRIGTAILGITACPCLGSITDNLPISPSVANTLLLGSLGYMLAFSILFTGVLLLPKQTASLPASLLAK